MSLQDEMRVTKRNGDLETIEFDKILKRIKTAGQEVDLKINYTALVMKVIDQLYDTISTVKIDELSAEQCASMSSVHPDYNILAGRIIVSNHQKNTSNSFSEVMTKLYQYLDKHGKSSPLVSEELYRIVLEYSDELDNLCDYSRDFLIDYFGFKTLERAYLMKIDGTAVERPQHMWLRVSIGIHGDNMEKVKKTYNLMSQKYFTHATPTLFNAGTPHPQLSSCFLMSMESDSIDGIYNTLKDCALISKWAGGIGLHIHNVRASGSHIRGTNGASNGIVPMLRVFNNTAKYVDQCVHPETIIYTTQGPKQIQQCVMGETEIINLTGNSEVIENVLEHYYDGDALEIESMHTIFPLLITPEHPVYVLPGQTKGVNYNVIKNRLEKNIVNFEWIDAKELSTSDMIVYSIPKYEKDIYTISEDDCYMYGIILGDGSMSNKTDASGYVSMHTTNKKNIAIFMENYFQNTCTDYKTHVNENTTRIRWNQNLVLPFRHADVYDENNTKRVHSKWLNLPIQKSKFILKGLLDTDGCKNNELVFDSTSYNLIESVRYICMKLGALTSGYIRDRVGESHDTVNGVIENKKISYCLRIPKTREICELLEMEYNEKQFFKFMRHGDYLLSRIQTIRDTKYTGFLYDLQMKTEHNYLLHNGIVHNGGGKRNGSFAIYLEPWHADIEMFLQMRKNHGDEELKARDLFYALWVPDLFMERVKTNGKWTLMCPDECPGLSDVYGDEFVALYTKYEETNTGRVTLNARDLWFQILDAQMETGTPYLLYKDAVNRKSNQKNVGVIKSSNLCVAPETMILTDKGHQEIQSLEGNRVNVWNGKEFSEVLICKTGTNQELMEVHTNDGCTLTCTKYHKFFIQGKNGNVIVRAANDLNIDDTIIHCEFPAIDGIEVIDSPYTQGVYSSDYGYNKNKSQKCVLLSTDKAFLKEYIDYIRTHTFFSEYENDRNILYLPDYLKSDNYIPFNARLRDKLEWFAGLIDIDGIMNESNDLLLNKISQKFLLKIKMMLQTCGINSRIVDISNMCDYKITKEYHQLIISNCDANKLINLGFNSRVFNKFIVSKKMDNLKECQFFYCKTRSDSELDLSVHNGSQRVRSNSEISTTMYEPILDRKIITSSNHFQVKISKIVKNGRHDDTFCFTEPKRNTGIFNGMLTSQCTEITEYSDENVTAVCNLASFAFPSFMDMTTEPPTLNYEKLHEVTKVVTENLNRIIDVNYYPTEKTRRSNMRHRPIGIGVQGLADVFMMMNIPFVSEQSTTLNKHIFETIYHAALERSCELAEEQGKYETFDGSPTSEGILQFDLWEVDPTNDRYDWTTLKQKIKDVGLRNSLLLAPMPTASTSQILGFNECIEPITSNIYNRRTIAGEFILTNKYLMHDLLKIDQWNEKTKNSIIANNGSIQHIETIPQEIRDKYKTVWEIPMRALIDMAADRGAYICQSQSLNLWQEDPNYNSLTSMHFYSWSKGLKTGIYYLRRRAKHQAQQFTIEPDTKRNEDVDEEDEICEMCSS